MFTVRPTTAIVLATFLGALFLVSCAASSTAPSATAGLGFTPGTTAQPRAVEITTSDTLMFAPADIKVAKGETVMFNVKNTGKIEHEFMVGPMADAFADTAGTPEVAGITAGTTKSVTFTFDGAGPYAFACHAEGHFEAGMKGAITLVGS